MEAHQFFVQEYIDDMFRRDGPGGPPCEWEWLSSNKGRVSHRNLQYIEYTSLLLL